MPIMDLVNDPVSFLRSMLISLPAILMALVLHECAHGYVAYKCGDPTAKLMGRLTLNPLKHLDPVGTLLMLFAGIGWAKPVPVNPLHYKHYRRDDLLVSIAGICMNLILCLTFTLLTQVCLTLLLHHIPDGFSLSGTHLNDLSAWVYYDVKEMYHYAYGIGAWVEEIWGANIGILYQMLAQVAVVNLSLALFNLIPVPPLDGYHVLNDLVLKRDLFANPNFTRIASSALFFVVMATDWLDKALSWAITHALGGLGQAGYAVVKALGLL